MNLNQVKKSSNLVGVRNISSCGGGIGWDGGEAPRRRVRRRPAAPAPVAAVVPKCDECDTKLVPKAKFCFNCGKKI